MECQHERIRCTDNRFFCIECGKELTEPKEPEQPEPEKKPRTRKKKEGAE